MFILYIYFSFSLLVSCLYTFIIVSLCLFICAFCKYGGSLTLNEDIERSWFEGGEVVPHALKKKEKNNFLAMLGHFVLL